LQNHSIILASTSIFRKTLLEKLHLPFVSAKPEIDETPLEHESVQNMVERLALQKAKKIASKTNNQIIIASDQSACFKDKPIGKPLNYQNALQQLTLFSNQTIVFYTALVVIDQNSNSVHQNTDITKVTFRELTYTDIHNYLTIEQPYQCAGSFKSEGLGISLFKSIQTTDPNALIGLPLIKLVGILKKTGMQIPPKK
jgi:MAF protein